MAPPSEPQPESDSNGEAVELLVQELRQLRQEQRVKEADILKQTLRNKYSIKVFYRRDGSVGWTAASPENAAPAPRVVWSMVDAGDGRAPRDDAPPPAFEPEVPLVLATVDTPCYRARLAETLAVLGRRPADGGAGFAPVAVDLLSLADHPALGAKRVLFEGWRRVLLPALSSLEVGAGGPRSPVLVGEDDVRPAASPARLRRACAAVFDAHPDLDVLSLGHAFGRRPAGPPSDGAAPPAAALLPRVRGLHGTTLLALRRPAGVAALRRALDAAPPCHLDHFLFRSAGHDLGVAVCDPPLAGWAEVGETLTSVGAGARRRGGGRLAHAPPADGGTLRWVRRRRVDG